MTIRRSAVLAALALAVSGLLASGTPASACPGWPCDKVNEVCALVKHPHCVM